MNSRSRIIGASVAALACLLGLSGWYSVQHLHNDLTQEALRHTAVELGVGDSFESLPHNKVALLDLLEPVGIVNLTVSGHHVTITGAPRPQEEIDRLKDASRRWGVSKVSYKVDASLPPATGSPMQGVSPSTTTTVVDGVPPDAGPRVAVTVADSRIGLSGAVASQQDHRALRQAAIAAFGLGRVDDEVVVQGGRSAIGGPDPVDPRVRALAGVIETAGRATSMRATLDNRSLEVVATVGDVAAKAAMDAAVVKAASAGMDASGAVSVDGLSPATTSTPPDTGGNVDEQVGALQAELDALAAEQTRSVFFAAGSSSLTPEADAVLHGVADAMNRYPLPVVDLGGHTDSDGDEAANVALSQSRAEAVLVGLVARGISPERLTAVGYGEAQPKADNATPEGRAANRRVEFTVKKGA